MNIWYLLLIFFGVSAVFCAIGFKKFVYFLSIGYGFSVAALGIAYFVYSGCKGIWDIVTILQCLLFVLYGARLSGFLLYREIKNANYRKVLGEATHEGEKKIPIFVSITVWLIVAALYVIQTAPVFFRTYNGCVWNLGTSPELNNILLPLIGVGISLIGLVIETLADLQKSAQKVTRPDMVAMKGLYKMVRCPNYFGEILFWTGVFVGGCMAYGTSVGMWIAAALGYVCIVYIMINGAQRLDRRQEKRYGSVEEYRAYADHTPIILPLIPIHHIGKYKPEDLVKKEKKQK